MLYMHSIHIDNIQTHKRALIVPKLKFQPWIRYNSLKPISYKRLDSHWVSGRWNKSRSPVEMAKPLFTNVYEKTDFSLFQKVPPPTCTPFPEVCISERWWKTRPNICISKAQAGSSLMVQQVKELMLSLLWHRFNPWPGNLCMLSVNRKKKYIYIYIYSKWKAQENFSWDDVVPLRPERKFPLILTSLLPETLKTLTSETRNGICEPCSNFCSFCLSQKAWLIEKDGRSVICVGVWVSMEQTWGGGHAPW